MKKIFSFFLYLTILAIPFYFLRFNIGSIPTTILEVLIYLTFVLSLISGQLKRLNNAPAVIFAGLFVLFSLVGVLVDPEKMRALGIWKAYFVDGYLLFLLVLSLDKKERQNALRYLVIGGTLCAVIAIFYFFNGVKSQDGRLLDLDRISPNYMAMLLAPIFIISVARSVEAKKLERYLMPISSIILLFGLYLTKSRGAIVACFAALAVLFFTTFLKTKYEKAGKFLLAVVLILGVALMAWFFKPDWSDNARKATSSNVRYYIWSVSLQIAKQNPVLGVGISNFQDYFSNMTKTQVNFPEFISPQALTAHNLYLQIYISCGLLALAAFAIFILSSRFWRLENVAACAALVAILFYGLVDTPFYRNDLAAVFWLILALNFYPVREDRQSPPTVFSNGVNPLKNAKSKA